MCSSVSHWSRCTCTCVVVRECCAGVHCCLAATQDTPLAAFWGSGARVMPPFSSRHVTWWRLLSVSATAVATASSQSVQHKVACGMVKSARRAVACHFPIPHGTAPSIIITGSPTAYNSMECEDVRLVLGSDASEVAGRWRCEPWCWARCVWRHGPLKDTAGGLAATTCTGAGSMSCWSSCAVPTTTDGRTLSLLGVHPIVVLCAWVVVVVVV